MKARSEYAEDNGMKRGSCRHAMLIPPPSPSNQPKNPSKQDNASGCIVSKGVELNLSLFRLWIPLCRALRASHSCFIQSCSPGLWLLSLSRDGSAVSPVPGTAVSLTGSFPVLSQLEVIVTNVSLPYCPGARPRNTVKWLNFIWWSSSHKAKVIWELVFSWKI